ncbi:protease HtpX, partial [Candidatus Woesearchaeota archaeon CG_4_10_14_0_8_um_filter_47_5]
MDNQVKTVLFLGLLSGLLLAVGSLFGTGGLFVALLFALAMNLFSYFFSDRIVLAMYRAHEVTEKEEKHLYQLVKDVAARAHIPMPRVYIIPSQSPNAFATGRSPEHASVAFTQGILSLLEDDELKGVIAHEISHVKNRDILIATIAATIASVISYIAVMARWAMIFGGMDSRRRDGSNIAEMLVLAILTPIIATLIQL